MYTFHFLRADRPMVSVEPGLCCSRYESSRKTVRGVWATLLKINEHNFFFLSSSFSLHFVRRWWLVSQQQHQKSQRGARSQQKVEPLQVRLKDGFKMNVASGLGKTHTSYEVRTYNRLYVLYFPLNLLATFVKYKHKYPKFLTWLSNRKLVQYHINPP